MTNTPVGWNERRKNKAGIFAGVAALCAVAALWAMFLPWIGMALGVNHEPTCDQNLPGAGVSTYQKDGETTTLKASGCVSPKQALKIESERSMDPATEVSMALAPSVTPRAGMPPTTFWLVFASVALVGAFVLRNGFLLAPAAFGIHLAYKNFSILQSYLAWGVEQYTDPMWGADVHRYALGATVVLMLSGGLFLLRVNTEQRKLDTEAFKNGERDRPPTLVSLGLIITSILRVNADKLSTTLSTETEKLREKK